MRKGADRLSVRHQTRNVVGPQHERRVRADVGGVLCQRASENRSVKDATSLLITGGPSYARCRFAPPRSSRVSRIWIAMSSLSVTRSWSSSLREWRLRQLGQRRGPTEGELGRLDLQLRNDAAHDVRRDNDGSLGIDARKAFEEDVGAVDLVDSRVRGVRRRAVGADRRADGDDVAPVSVREPASGLATTAAAGLRRSASKVAGARARNRTH